MIEKTEVGKKKPQSVLEMERRTKDQGVEGVAVGAEETGIAGEVKK